jgi:hypothetical protein
LAGLLGATAVVADFFLLMRRNARRQTGSRRRAGKHQHGTNFVRFDDVRVVSAEISVKQRRFLAKIFEVAFAPTMRLHREMFREGRHGHAFETRRDQRILIIRNTSASETHRVVSDKRRNCDQSVRPVCDEQARPLFIESLKARGNPRERLERGRIRKLAPKQMPVGLQAFPIAIDLLDRQRCDWFKNHASTYRQTERPQRVFGQPPPAFSVQRVPGFFVVQRPFLRRLREIVVRRHPETLAI